ncbi:MAG: ABC transporter substrate-binding protein [Thermomicrobiales bacterium]
MRVTDTRTIAITLDAPKAYFLMKLTHPSSSVVDEANVRAGGTNWAQKPNGSGPFRVEKLGNDELTLRRFDRFYAGAPTLDRVNVLYGQKSGEPMNLYEAGTIDYTGVPLSSADRVLVETSPLGRTHGHPFPLAHLHWLQRLRSPLRVPPSAAPSRRPSTASASPR